MARKLPNDFVNDSNSEYNFDDDDSCCGSYTCYIKYLFCKIFLIEKCCCLSNDDSDDFLLIE